MDIKAQLRAIADAHGAILRGQTFHELARAALAEIERLESALADCERGTKPRKSRLFGGE
jgi:hypothetical protein